MNKEQLLIAKSKNKIPFKVIRKGEVRYTLGTSFEQVKSKFKKWFVIPISWECFEENYKFKNTVNIKTKKYDERNDTTFDSSMLKIGEMMETETTKYIIIRTYDGFVSLTNPNDTWDEEHKLIGRKLEPGEGITLIQE